MNTKQTHSEKLVASIKASVETYCAKHNVSLSKFGKLALNDPTAYWKLSNMTIWRLDRIERFMRAKPQKAK